jgi:glycosyltransferase involved in cell wall biosynthesis
MSQRIGIVVIGRNEGERLRACLAALPFHLCPVVYVDSGSTDGSLPLAAGLGARVLALDMALPFTAGRARNEGLRVLLAMAPDLAFVQFIDGDCTLLPGWLDAACEAMTADPRRAVVIGQLIERQPDASVYNRLCALEWASPAGDLRDYGALGGIMLVRVAAFHAVGGFNPQVIAGEDSEFGVRCGLAGHVVTKLALPMATHDADIRSFAQWWKRAVRSGHAIGQRARLNGDGPLHDCRRDLRSALAWGLALPGAALALAAPTGGASLIVAAAGFALLAARVYRHRRRRGDTARDAWLYARHLVLTKFAQVIGLARFQLNVLRGQFRIIEYK